MLIFFRLMKLGILILKVWSHVLSLVRPTRVVNIESKRFHHTITYRRMEISRINRSLKAYKAVKYCPLVVHNGYVFITTPLFFFSLGTTRDCFLLQLWSWETCSSVSALIYQGLRTSTVEPRRDKNIYVGT